MSNQVQQNHDHLWELLPWYVNGTLDEAERAAVAHHIAVCSECKDEVARCRITVSALQSGDADAWSPSPERVAQMMERIQAESSPAAKPSWHRLSLWVSSILLSFKGMPRVAGWGLAVSAVIVLLLVVHEPWQFGVPRGPPHQTTEHTSPAPDTMMARDAEKASPDEQSKTPPGKAGGQLHDSQRTPTSPSTRQKESGEPKPDQSSTALAQREITESKNPDSSSTQTQVASEQRAQRELVLEYPLKSEPGRAPVGLGSKATPQPQSLTKSAVSQTTDQVQINIAFAQDTTEADIKALLDSFQGKIVKGPSENGVYTVSVPVSGGDFNEPMETRIEKLRSNPKVRFAEAVKP
jgi:Putative zinc-finger